jgi:uncharacterized membrane protein YphA (DoxX/SURF4 family)
VFFPTEFRYIAVDFDCVFSKGGFKSGRQMATPKIGQFFEKQDFGLLLFRVLFGACLAVHGVCSLRSGGALKHLGEAATAVGLPFSGVFWGIVAALLLITCGIFTILGFFFRVAMAITLVMGLVGAWQRMSLAFFFVSPYAPSALMISLGLTFLFIGPGRFGVKK